MKLQYTTQQYSGFDGDMDVVRSFDNSSYCAAQCLKDGRVVLGDGRSPDEAMTLCKYESIRVLQRPSNHQQLEMRTGILAYPV